MTNKPQYISLPFAWNQSTMNRKNASNPPPPGRDGFSSHKKTPRGVCHVAEVYPGNISGNVSPIGAIQTRTRKHTHPSHTEKAVFGSLPSSDFVWFAAARNVHFTTHIPGVKFQCKAPLSPASKPASFPTLERLATSTLECFPNIFEDGTFYHVAEAFT